MSFNYKLESSLIQNIYLLIVHLVLKNLVGIFWSYEQNI